jgi:hypothetical protein
VKSGMGLENKEKIVDVQQGPSPQETVEADRYSCRGPHSSGSYPTYPRRVSPPTAVIATNCDHVGERPLTPGRKL